MSKHETVDLSSKSITAANSTYPKGGVSCSADSFVVAESSVLRMKFSAKNPALRVAAKRSPAIAISEPLPCKARPCNGPSR